MSSSAKDNSNRTLIASIADEDTTTGLLLAGTGEKKAASQNFLIVSNATSVEKIEETFDNFTNDRDDIAILLINQHIAEKIRSRLDSYVKAFPAVLEIPSKEYPYDPEKDSVMKRVQKLFGDV
ncbi:V-type proton ATPase subunit F [Taphrina deformans PYCC 5710]|jgi:V-type H+-transporting ATPase subunit F|uniref:V-type proton ATPase subunit F n=1 Tax=Taphrina deformans (strain PYCC 5710 / ATCC 11124 / CBS 356.35 / IMI 108563 / JCM 9778 / NBRC 8474) TaxID=1097556 RepID=R4XBF3_TAPDE|nr:V-type proton ATPase subunit F [Taphrina deformans PYCC 5710]|eukprot:CCG83189.1 V-type proton ATPase subunit F [Taphrina deformans PYCC 5710]